MKHFFEIRANQIDFVVVTLDAMSYTLGAAAVRVVLWVPWRRPGEPLRLLADS